MCTLGRIAEAQQSVLVFGLIVIDQEDGAAGVSAVASSLTCGQTVRGREEEADVAADDDGDDE